VPIVDQSAKWKKGFPDVNPGFGIIVRRYVKSYFRVAAAEISKDVQKVQV